MVTLVVKWNLSGFKQLVGAREVEEQKIHLTLSLGTLLFLVAQR